MYGDNKMTLEYYMMRNALQPCVIGTGIILVLIIGISGVAQTTTPREQAPWSLRDHYTFSGTVLNLDYAKDNAEWRVKLYEADSETSRINPDVIVRDVGFSIELTDGRIITHDMLGQAGETIYGRETFTSEHFGDGTTFSVKFVPYEGLFVEHKIARFMNWNFLLISVSLTNTSDKPIGVSRIQSAIFGPGSISSLTENAQISSRNFVFRGGYPVYTRNKGADTVFIYDPERKVSLAMGLLPSDKADSVIDIQPGGGTWQGRIESSFAPGITLGAGETLQSDPIWFCLDIPPVVADAQFAQILQHYSRKESAKQAPRAWVTIPDTHGIAALRREAEAVKDSGIMHALIPGNWEGRPGSFEGGAPQYPRNIGDAARSLRDAGVSAGITIDPLLGDGNSGAWVTKSADGRSWVNLNIGEGREFSVKRIQKLVGYGFSFIVIEESTIPDEVLTAFDITRAQADALAFDAAYEAVGTAPVAVLPGVVAHLQPLRDEWLEAVAAVSRMAEFNIGTAPVRFASENSAAMDEDTRLAFRFWRGPVEFVGAPKGALKTQVSEVLGQKPLVARPQDTYRKAPLTWLMRCSSGSTGYIGTSILAFGGANPWKIQDIELFGGETAPTLIWYPQDNKPVFLQDGITLTTPNLATYGALLESNQPLFAGTTQAVTLGLERLKSISWDGSRGILTGLLDSAPATSSVFFLAPSSLTLQSARLNSTKIKPEVEGQWISFPLPASGGSFELEFRTK
jgi:hypothetical protein